jgi:mannose-6-phosphate isomerase-like protein (cupin superfamily)
MKPTTPITYQPYLGVQPYVTKDRSTIRELMCPTRHGNQAQSLAEAIIPAGGRTLLHRHLTSEEIYYIVRGDGMMTLDGKAFFVKAGDTICIPPGTPHAIKAGTRERLRILCACSPAYSRRYGVARGRAGRGASSPQRVPAPLRWPSHLPRSASSPSHSIFGVAPTSRPCGLPRHGARGILEAGVRHPERGQPLRKWPQHPRGGQDPPETRHIAGRFRNLPGPVEGALSGLPRSRPGCTRMPARAPISRPCAGP